MRAAPDRGFAAVVIAAVENKAAARFYGAAVKDGEVREGGSGCNLQLCRELRERKARYRPVDDQAHSPFCGMSANIDDRLCKAVVGHSGHCN